MKKIYMTLILCGMCLAGCENLRFVPGEVQKQNAWLHNRTAIAISEKAKVENTSEQLKKLTQLSEIQSRAFSSYYGMPKEFPSVDTVEQILCESNFQLADTAMTESLERPEGWEMADNIFELVIGISALLGGVYGTKAVTFLREARLKSAALKEIIQGNELFKQRQSESAAAFKEAQKNQSTETRQLVAQMKIS